MNLRNAGYFDRVIHGWMCSRSEAVDWIDVEVERLSRHMSRKTIVFRRKNVGQRSIVINALLT